MAKKEIIIIITLQFTVGERAWTVDSIQDLKQGVTSVLMDTTP